MNGAKIGLFALILLLGVTLPVAGNLVDIAGASNAAVSSFVTNAPFVLLVDSSYGSMRVETRDTGSDSDRCNRCDLHDCDSCATLDYSRCQRCDYVTEFRCDLYSCSWPRAYGCSKCP